MLVFKTFGEAVVMTQMRNPFKTRSFQLMFFLSFLLFAFLLVMVLGSISYFITNQEVARQTIQSRKLLLNEINKQLNAQMKAVESESLAISSNPKVMQYLQYGENSYERYQLSADVLDLLSRPSYTKEAIHSMQLYAKNAATDQFLGSNGVSSYGRISRYPWFHQIKNSDNCWIGPHPSELDDYSSSEGGVVSFARKVLSPSRTEIGILVVNIHLSFLRSIVAGGAEDGTRYILDSSNRLITEIAAPGMTADMYGSADEEIGRILDRTPNEAYAISHLKKKELMIWSRQPQSGWIALDIIPWSSVTKGSDRIKQVIRYGGIVCVLLAVLMAFLLSSQFVKPIRRLIRVMDKVNLGYLDVEIRHSYHNEFGNLYRHFNQMIGRIRELLREINEQNRMKREAELQMLQEQINPHFIYNTLDIINWHAIEHGAHDVSRMLSLLGKMLRIGLSKGAAFIPVKKEIEHLNCYIELQKIRYNHKIHFSVAIDASIEEYYIPKLVIQPFVENSLLHAFHTGEIGSVSIVGKETGNDIEFTIADDGVGVNLEGGAIDDRQKGGMSNVHNRIRLYFGDGYGVNSSSSAQSGTTITIRMPKITSEPSAA